MSYVKKYLLFTPTIITIITFIHTLYEVLAPHNRNKRNNRMRNFLKNKNIKMFQRGKI